MSKGWRTAFQRLNLYAGTYLHALLTVGLLALLGLMWIRGNGGAVEDARTTNARAFQILQSLKVELVRNEAAERMQTLFPEGACFLWSLYGWAWANLAEDASYRAEALTEIKRALNGQNSAAAIDPFRYDTTVRRGAFWLGQRNLLLGKYLNLQPNGGRETSLTVEFHANSADYHDAVMNGPVHQVESYENMCWPADAPAGLASLVLHDELFGTTYSEALETWKNYHSTHGWDGTILPAGRLDAKTGQHIEPARGCANSLMIALLASVDRDYAGKLYKDYQSHFKIVRAGFQMFREYPEKATGFTADVDSGPIVWGAGVTATGVGLAAARAVGDTSMERDVRDLSEMFGFPFTRSIGEETALHYLFGQLPVGDAFLAWGWSIPRGTSEVPFDVPPVGNRWHFNLIAVGVLILLVGQWVLVLRSFKNNRKKLLP